MILMKCPVMHLRWGSDRLISIWKPNLSTGCILPQFAIALSVSCLAFAAERGVKKVAKFCGKNLEVNQKVVPLHSHLKNGWLMRLRVLEKTGAEIFLKRFFENSFKKVWKSENNAYLCSPVRKTGSRKRD